MEENQLIEKKVTSEPPSIVKAREGTSSAGRLTGLPGMNLLRPCSFVLDWRVGTIPNRIASIIYINFN
jgi:hypothetical protein